MCTAITVVYNTKNLIDNAVISIRKFYPDIKLIIINGSTVGSECDVFLKTNPYENCMIENLGYNIGHGNGMHLGLRYCNTEKALIFDSDIEMIKGGIIEAMNLTNDKYGVGEICYVDKHGSNCEKNIKYLHPYFMLINVKQYHKYHKFVHHGAPCLFTMLDLKNDMKIDFPIKDYILHHWRGTRNLKPKDFLKNWHGNI